MSAHSQQIQLQTTKDAIETLKKSIAVAEQNHAKTWAGIGSVLQTEDEDAYRAGLRRETSQIADLKNQLQELETQYKEIQFQAMPEINQLQIIQNKLKALKNSIVVAERNHARALSEIGSVLQTEDEDAYRAGLLQESNHIENLKNELQALEKKYKEIQPKVMQEINKNVDLYFKNEMKMIDEDQKIAQEWTLSSMQALIQEYSDPVTHEIAVDAVRINNHPLGGVNLRRIWEKSTLDNQARVHTPASQVLSLGSTFKDPMMSHCLIDRTQLISANDEVLLSMIACRNAILKNPGNFMRGEEKDIAETVASYFYWLSATRIAEGETMFKSFQEAAYSKLHTDTVYCAFKALCHIHGPEKQPLMTMNTLGHFIREAASVTINYETNSYQLRPMLALSTIDSLGITTLKYNFKVAQAPATSDDMRGADRDTILQAIETGLFAPQAPNAPLICPGFTQAQYQASIKERIQRAIASKKTTKY